MSNNLIGPKAPPGTVTVVKRCEICARLMPPRYVDPRFQKYVRAHPSCRERRESSGPLPTYRLHESSTASSG